MRHETGFGFVRGDRTTSGRNAAALRAAAVMAAALGCVVPALAQGVQFPADANVVSVLTFGAVPNDGLDDAPAFQAALNATVATGRILYVPDGVYDFNDRLNWGGIGSGAYFTLQGQSQSGTILRLRDNAPGFQFNYDANYDCTANEPKPFIDAYETGNTSACCDPSITPNCPSREGNTANAFRNYLRDLTIDVGSGNPGAIGLQFQSNNTGRIQNVTIRSAGPGRAGVVGLDLAFNFPGPFLAQNLTIEGFDEAVRGAPQEYSVVFENLTIRNQNVRGIGFWRLPVQIRNLVSVNSVTAVTNFSNPGAWGHIVIDGASLTGGSPTADAIVNEDGSGVLLLRNISTSGYRFAVNDLEVDGAPPVTLPDGFVAQHSTDAPLSANPSPTAIVNIPVEDAPAPPSIPIGQWASVKTFGAIENDNLDDTAAVQAALVSGAPLVYFPSGFYLISDTLTVGPNVERIEGLTSTFAVNAPLATESRPVFLIPPGSRNVVHIGGFNDGFRNPGAVNSVWFEQATANTLVVRDGDFSYRNTVPGGKVFLENVVGTNMVFTGQRVWARQLNPEGGDPQVVNDGGDFYALGVKTEGSGTVMVTRNRGRTAILGGLNYPATTIVDRTRPAFVNDESSFSISMPESCYIADGWYNVWVRETRGGVVTDFTRAALVPARGHSNCGGMLSLYNGYVTDASPPLTPGAPSLVSATGSAITLEWGASADAESGVARYNIYVDGVFYRSVMPVAPLRLVDDGLADGVEREYAVSAVNGAGLESPRSGSLTVSTLADEQPPRLISAATGLDPRSIWLEFSEPLAIAPAQHPANYQVSGPVGVSVVSAQASADGLRVRLTTSPLSAGEYTLALSGLLDRASVPNQVSPGTRSRFAYNAASAGTGLTGTYWSNREFTGSPLLTRLDPEINFDYGFGSPASGAVPADNFAVRWQGQLRPRFDEVYTIFARSDDGVRVFIDGVLLIDQWVGQAPTEVSATVALDSTRTHDVVVEYFEGAGGALMELRWQSASQAKEIIPSECLFPTPRLTTVRTFQGVGADHNLVRFSSSDDGSGQAIGVFHSPAAGGFHSASYFRFDLAPFDLANNYPIEAVATLSQTFFGIGDGKRLINIFGVRQSAGGDGWIEAGAGHVTWDTAVGNDNSGGLANPVTSRWVWTYLLDNTGFQNNNRPDKAFFKGDRLLEMVREDTDGRLTFLMKRVDASNEGQSWFTKEWGIPGFAPALKLLLAPKCPAIIREPLPSEVIKGQSIALTAEVRGLGPLMYQWLRNGVAISDGPGGAAPGGGVVAGASGVLSSGGAVGLSIASAMPSDSGGYTINVVNSCGSTTSGTVALGVTDTCPLDLSNNDVVDANDIFSFLGIWFSGPPGSACTAPPTGCAGDWNSDGVITADDIFAYLSDWFAYGPGTPCP